MKLKLTSPSGETTSHDTQKEAAAFLGVPARKIAQALRTGQRLRGYRIKVVE